TTRTTGPGGASTPRCPPTWRACVSVSTESPRRGPGGIKRERIVWAGAGLIVLLLGVGLAFVLANRSVNNKEKAQLLGQSESGGRAGSDGRAPEDRRRSGVQALLPVGGGAPEQAHRRRQPQRARRLRRGRARPGRRPAGAGADPGRPPRRRRCVRQGERRHRV